MSLLFAQEASGGPLMCQQDGSWFQAAVLSAENSTRQTREDPVSVFPKLNKFDEFFSRTLGTLLSPKNTTAANTTTTTPSSSGTLPHLVLHLVLLSLCLQLFL